MAEESHHALRVWRERGEWRGIRLHDHKIGTQIFNKCLISALVFFFIALQPHTYTG